MSSMFFTFATLLCICGFQYTGCAPSFTQKQNNGNDYFVLNGTNTLSLIWDYNSDGESVREVSLLYVDESTGSDVYVAAKFGSSALIVYHSSYTGRVQFFARATFTIDKIIPSDSRQFKCLVNFNTPLINPGIPPGMVSDVRVIVVVRPSITLKSSTLELNEGETRTLLCVSTGNPKPSYKWEKDGAVLQQGTTSNYTISSAKKEDRGRYKCTAEVDAPGLSTYRASYSVDVKVKFAPQVTRLSSNQTLDDGNDATFSCTAEAYPMPITYNWFKNVVKISSSAEFVINDLGWESRLTVRQISKSRADRYSCSGTNSVGEGQKKSVFLNVRYAPQAVTVTATTPEVKEGQSVTLRCQSDGFPSPSFSWRFNGNTINGALNNEFLVANAEVKDAGNYTCIATNIRGSKQFTRMVNVRYKPTQTNFTTGNVRNTAVQGTTVTLTCSANGFPAPTYVIKRNGTQVTQSGGKHVIMNIQLNAEYDRYACEPTNDEGPGPIKTFQITVEIPLRFPATSLSSLNKTENETYTFSCTAEAKPAATILWMLNNENITRVPPYSINTSVTPIQNSKLKKTLSYLKITRITWRQKGLYSCIAHNSAGQQRQSAVLGVRYRPVVQFPEDHPKNHTVAVGETVTFYCKTIGNPPTKRHKWQFNGVDIPGESCDNGCSSIQYTKNAVVHQDAGQYSCIGYNDLGYGPPATAELFVKRGKCEEQCNNGTKCRYFGKYLCLCEKGKKGAMCTTNENLAMSFKTGFQFRNEDFKPEYEDLKNPITKTFINRIEETILKVFRGSGITYVMVTRLRSGSVIADVVLIFDVQVGESEVEALLRDVTKDSDFEVFEVVDRTVIPEAPFEPEGNSKNDVIYASLVIGLLVLILVTVVVCFIRKRKIRGQRDRRAESWAVESSHFNSGTEIETENENSSHTDSQPPYMELREVPNSQGRMEELYSEIHEYAPLHPNTRSWEVSRQSVVIDKMIGQGSFGQVAQGRASQLPWMEGTVTVAIKMLKANAQEMEKKDLLSELEVMKTLKPHPHVIKLLGCVTMSDPILVIIEYVPYGDLLGYLRKSRRLNDTYFQDADVKPETNLSSLQLMKISWQIADGMSYLSSRNIVHRDLAARNVLVGERETCKVTDFGMARDVHSENVYERKTEGRIPLKWTAYEAVMYGRYTTKSDVWSFGVVLYEIFTIGGSPYPQTSGRKVMELLGEGYRMPKPNHVAEMLYQLMLNCWQQEPHDRPTFEQLRRELKLMENQHKRLINMKDYDKKLYENVEDLMF
ncbi:fibroblast growth factor receptor 3-like isoform X2 [Montipora capricornis]|uniref:fibroblast growth factor receptor 3-like isoform X2 n=1 Tax=Montipora capricornis TaxID=246305 RepID=UPI0035F1A355